MKPKRYVSKTQQERKRFFIIYSLVAISIIIGIIILCAFISNRVETSMEENTSQWDNVQLP